MKSTLFHTVLVCLAALSLAGCGGHSNDDNTSSASSSPSNIGLLNPGRDHVTLQGSAWSTQGYTIALYRTNKCIITIKHNDGDVVFEGSWQDMTESPGIFKIAFVGPFVTTANASIGPIDTVELTLPEGTLVEYRNGHTIDGAQFSTYPFSFNVGNDFIPTVVAKTPITVTP